MKNIMKIAAVSCIAIATTTQAGEWDFGASVGLESRVFIEDPKFEGQLDSFQPSLILEPDIRWETDDGKRQIVFLPYARIDGEDDERTHFDVREAYVRHIGDDYEVLVGAAKVFWGVTESRHLVDIINQTDAVEDIDEEDKLGQPMVKASFFRDWGQLDFFYLPFFRERTFPGEEGRLRFLRPVETDAVRYEESDEEWSPSFAARYSHYFGNWDVSLNAFHGTSREPRITFDLYEGSAVLAPVYEKITQGGVTAQYTNDAWLWKFEGIVREGHGDTFAAAVGGLEYTFFGITESGADLGVLVEYLYDGRDETLAPPTTLENDVFLGARYALNDIQDTSVLAGLITDVEDASISGLIEAERRFGNNWTGEVEARFFTNIDEENLLSSFEDDSHLTFRLTRYF